MTKLAQILPKTVPLAVHGFPAASTSEIARQQCINQYLEVLSNPPLGIVTKTLAESGREGYVIDYQSLMPTIAQSLVEAYIHDTMGSLSTRLYRILREKKIADDKMVRIFF